MAGTKAKTSDLSMRQAILRKFKGHNIGIEMVDTATEGDIPGNVVVHFKKIGLGRRKEPLTLLFDDSAKAVAIINARKLGDPGLHESHSLDELIHERDESIIPALVDSPRHK